MSLFSPKTPVLCKNTLYLRLICHFSVQIMLADSLQTTGVIEGFKLEIYDLEKPVCETIKTTFANCVTNNVKRCQIFVIYPCPYRFYTYFCAQYDSPRFPLVQRTRGVFDFYKKPAPCNTRKKPLTVDEQFPYKRRFSKPKSL